MLHQIKQSLSWLSPRSTVGSGHFPAGNGPAASSSCRKRKSQLAEVVAVIAFVVSCSGIVGCMDGPFYAIKSTMPWTQQEWAKDRALGATYQQRLGEFDLLDSSIPTMDEAEKQNWSNVLAGMLERETSPELRRRAVRCLGKIPGEVSEQALAKAGEDDAEKVRLEVCQAWLQRGDATARKRLSEIAVSDGSASVRVAALEGLGKTAGPEARDALAAALEDDDPAIQHQAILSLKNITGEDFQGDVAAWQDFLAKTPSLPDQPRMVQGTWTNWIPTVR